MFHGHPFLLQALEYLKHGQKNHTINYYKIDT